MPIMAVDERNDARGAAYLLASTARECIDNPKIAQECEIALNNVYRLLEAYRVNEFFGVEPPVKQNPRGVAEMLTLLPPAERHVKEVRDALDGAKKTIFKDQSKDDAIEAIEDVLRLVAYPQPNQEIADKDRTQASLFFEQVLKRLNFT